MLIIGALALFPLAFAFAVWLSPLVFAPVPWPDDAAFYFVAKELFQWPPRWVMLPQAPFVPSYAEWNFNTMPLYPILIGLGRWLGIDGSFALKLWPMGAWALSASLLGIVAWKKSRSLSLAMLAQLLILTHFSLRWGSVIVRPESLIGLCGLALILGLTWGWPEKVRSRRFFHPASALLALAAYAHFNAIHLVFPVALSVGVQKKRFRELLRIGALTALYLIPWGLTVLRKPTIFLEQMGVQWRRLAVPNGWLDHPAKIFTTIFPDLGIPYPLPNWIQIAGLASWIAILLAVVCCVACLTSTFKDDRRNLLPSAAWVLSALWLWHTKPETWFVVYLHLAIAAFLVVLLWESRRNRLSAGLVAAVSAGLVLTSSAVLAFQYRQLSSPSFTKETFHQFVSCIDDRLSKLDAALGHKRPFRVWAPTFPDITIELDRKHPDWEISRTNDFHEKTRLALAHARAVQAVVIPESIAHIEEEIDGPLSEHSAVRSVWLEWKAFYYYTLWSDPLWKPRGRWVCQKGRWLSHIFGEWPNQSSARHSFLEKD